MKLTAAAKVIEEPREAAIVEVDDAEPVAFDEQVGEAEVGVNEAKPLLAPSVSLDAPFKFVGDPLQQPAAIVAQAKTGAPVTP
ncbi:hypothetical protein ACVIHH_003986 [Bradyrhizobium sp. USDA 4518]